VLAIVWWFPFFPTGDGPSHLYNAAILRQALGADSGRQLDYFDVTLRPFPNWTGHALLAALLGIATPPVAEKVLVSAYLVGWAVALDVFLGATGACLPAIAMLGAALAIHLPLMLGFYNFSLGLMIYVLTLGSWLGGLGGSGAGATAIGLLLLVGYFSHPITFALTLAAMSWTWALDSGRRRGDIVRLAMASSPALALLGWYLLLGFDPHATAPLDTVDGWVQRRQELDCLWYGDRGQHHVAWLVGAAWLTFLGVAIANPADARPGRRALLGFAAILLVLALALPPRIGGHGGYVVVRLALVAMLTALGGFTLPPARRIRHGATAAMTAVLAMSLIALLRYETRANQDVARYLTGLDRFPRRSVFVPVVERRSPFRVDPLAHTSSYYAMATDGIDLGNYEADLYYFPVRFRADAPRPADVPTLQRRFDTLDLERAARLVDALLVWGAVPVAVEGSPAFRRLGGDPPLSIFLSTRRPLPAAP